MSLQLSETTKKMLKDVTPIYSNDIYSLSIFEANGFIMEAISKFTNDLTSELFPQNATWSLIYWEEFLGIKDIERKNQVERIQKVLYELNKYFTVTLKRMETVVNTFVENKNAKVLDVDNEYRFIILLPQSNNKISPGLFEAVEEIKPAHLMASYRLEANAKEYVSSACLSGGTITIYPYYPTNSNMQTKMIFGAITQSAQSIEIYPKGD
ncbi:putative phage tail protein [Lysinibacillus sp. Bpr_S20]|uniref:putative phage tail protein n=1 Tax=Lysinibacillus sp. Bpr_S20 TaxID=2933964 RepID=UPI002012C28B|nr:putative phage tail protein [Lysinibacillus sp. Bpr_S20]MCL1701634.1 YmfQ family protein [Lysinibacillus sp. Bpr_S20]